MKRLIVSVLLLLALTALGIWWLIPAHIRSEPLPVVIDKIVQRYGNEYPTRTRLLVDTLTAVHLYSPPGTRRNWQVQV